MTRHAFYDAIETASRTIAWPLIELHIERLTGQRDLDRVPSSRYAEIVKVLRDAMPKATRKTKAQMQASVAARNARRRERRKRLTVCEAAELRAAERERERRRHAKP